jgi:ubiquinone/menaquinone biosynthesis C-methylase UbiE
VSDRNLERQIGFYRRHASRFDRSITSLGSRENRNHFRKIAAITDALDLADQRIVLEVGTGTGLHARWLLERTDAAYVGLDASIEMLELARDRTAAWSDRARVVVGDAQLLPFEDEAFPAVFCSGTLHHVERPWDGVAELVRVVRRGGPVAVMEPNWKFPTVLAASVLSKIERNAFKINPARLRTWAEDAGLVDVEVRPLLYTPPRPRRFERAFDRIDARLERVPLLRALSVMLLLTGRRA